MAVSPILPGNFLDPTGADKIERGAMNDFARRLKVIRNYYVAQLDRLDYNVITVNSLEPNEQRYQYLIDQATLADIFRNTDRYVDEILLQGGEYQNWFFEGYVSTAYQRGTAQTFANLGAQSVVYKSGQVSLQTILRSQPYLDRISLIRARVFEEMKGLSGNVKANMSRVLSDGVGRGLNPRDIAKNLTDQLGIEEFRANRIARTEVTVALKRARWDESEYAQENYGIKLMLMHFSALSPTTRLTHALRHGKLYTIAQVRQWFAEGANSINCKCTTIEVMVDDDGKPLVPAIERRAREALEKAKASSNFTVNLRKTECECC